MLLLPLTKQASSDAAKCSTADERGDVHAASALQSIRATGFAASVRGSCECL